jgi:fatty acid desaturase
MSPGVSAPPREASVRSRRATNRRTMSHCATHFSLRDARRVVSDLFEPRPLVYWADFLVSLAVGEACFLLVRRVVSLPLVALLYVASVLAIYRAALFIHELAHLRAKSLRWFHVAWNVLYGVPFLVPSFLYTTHWSHHVRKNYATEADGEYLPLASGPAGNIFWYLSQSFFIPFLAIIRFLVLTPLAWCSAGLRRWVRQRASSMIIDPSYVRPLPTRVELRGWRLQEAAVFVYLVAVAGLLVAGRLPLAFLVQAYATAVGVIMLNAVRTLAAHRYLYGGEEVTFLEQLLDSLNYPNWPLVSGLWAPVGLRFHALHHLFPSLPYHALAEAHRRLMAELPPDSPYRQTVSPGLWWSLRTLWRNARASTAAV